MLRSARTWRTVPMLPSSFQFRAVPHSLALYTHTSQLAAARHGPLARAWYTTEPPKSNTPSDLELKRTDKLKKRAAKIWLIIKEGAIHYWFGTRLLVKNVQISSNLLSRSLHGYTLTRREDRMLRRTLADLVRLVPFAAFVIIPFMEFLLPVALKLFPGMLPSTFDTPMSKEEAIKKRLKIKLKMAEYLQKSVQRMAEELALKNEPGSATALELEHFVKKIREGKLVNNTYLLRFSKLFNDEFTLDNLPRHQLIAMARYLDLVTFGTDPMLRVRLERKLREIRADDKDIAWEGVKTMTDSELKQACMARGMRPDLPRDKLETQLEQWLELSKQNVPSSLMILSRIFMIFGNDADPEPAQGLAAAMRRLPEEVVDEMVMEKRLATEDKSLSNADRLEFILDQEAMIRTERNVQGMPNTTTPPPGSSVKPEQRIAEVCNAILTLSSCSAVKLESEELNEIRTMVKDAPGVQKAPSKEFVEKLIRSIQSDIKTVDKELGKGLHVIDTDGDGVIGGDELQAAFKFLRFKADPGLVQDLLNMFDPDSDGKIKLQDVQTILDRLEAGEKAEGLVGEATARKAMFDRDHLLELKTLPTSPVVAEIPQPTAQPK